jgi:hypothetical protein
MSESWCLCCHPESAHRLVTDDTIRCTECGCGTFEYDAFYEPPTRHADHRTPVTGCLDCEDELYDARCLEAQEPWNDPAPGRPRPT